MHVVFLLKSLMPFSLNQSISQFESINVLVCKPHLDVDCLVRFMQFPFLPTIDLEVRTCVV